MTRQRRHHADRGHSTDPEAGLPGPGQALIGYPEPESSLFGVPLQVARVQEARDQVPWDRVTREPLARSSNTGLGRPTPPRPRTSPEDTGGRPGWPPVLGLPLAVLVLGVTLGVIAVVMLIAAGVQPPWETRPVASAPSSPLPALTTPSTPVPTTRTLGATSITTDGSYRVGPDIRAGRYVTEGGVGCHWARLRDTGGVQTMVTEGNGSGRTVVRIRSNDTIFQTSGCTVWTRR